MVDGLRFRKQQIKDKSALTIRQQQVYEFIRAEIAEKGVSPTLTEVMRRFGFKSWENSKRFIQCLVDKGYLLKKPGTWRGIYLPVKRYDKPPYAGFFWYYENNFSTRKPVEVIMNGAMQLEQTELGTCQRKPIEKLSGKWEFIQKGSE